MKKIMGLSLLVATVLVSGNQIDKLNTQQSYPYYRLDVIIKNGLVLDRILINGPAVPPPNSVRPTVNPALIKNHSSSNNDIKSTTDNTMGYIQTPSFSWSFGCAATSAAMLAGYYDRNGYPYVYSGPTNEGKTPLDNSSWPKWTDESGDTWAQTPLSATHKGLDGRTTRGHVDDYWVKYGSMDDDPFVTNGWTEHIYGECTADFMKTNQTTNYGNSDGSTAMYEMDDGSPLTAEIMEENGIADVDGIYGIKLFFESRGYKVTTLYTQKIDTVAEGGFTFEQYKAEIDAGHPVMIQVVGHSMLGVGYNDTNNTVYLHDTWDYDTHSMTWGGNYANMNQTAVSVIHLAPNNVAGDFNKDGIPDLFFRNDTTGKNLIFFLYETGVRASYAYTTPLSSDWKAAGTGDFNGDNIRDILYRNDDTGKNLIYFQNADGSRAAYAYTSSISSAWHVAGIADFNGDKIADILFRNSSNGKNLIFFQNKNGSRASYAYTTKVGTSWHVAATKDFNNDGIADILYRDQSTGKNLISFQKSDGSRASYAYTTKVGSNWKVGGTGDFNKDGVVDILYRNTETGKNLISFQNIDGSRASYAYTHPIGTDWKVAGVADFNGDKIADIFYRNSVNGKNLISFQNANGSRASYKYTTPLSTAWKAVD